MKGLVKFVNEAIQELQKVTWPTRQAVLRMTLGVIIISAVFALFIGVVDVGLTKGLEAMLSFIARRQQTSQSSNSSPIQVNPGDIKVETNSTTPPIQVK